MKKDISNNILPEKSKIIDVLERLNSVKYGIVFIVDNSKKLLGIFTDNDIRKAFVKGASPNSPALDFMNSKFIYGKESNTRDENVALFTKNKLHLPILDLHKRLVDFISYAEIWKTPVMEPSFGGNELKYVSDCITSKWISSQGGYVKKFEKIFRDFFNTKYSLSCSNGTSALHLALKAINIKNDDEVIIPNFTFAAVANVVLHCNGKPVLVDVDKKTWTINPDLIEQKITKKTKAIIPVHIYGHPCDMDPIMEIARKHKLIVVEDCAEALGAQYKNKLVGTIGHFGCFSFFANKVITTGEGGIVITNDKKLYDEMEIYRDHGMRPSKRYWNVRAGFNFRMTNLQAAVGLAQMERIDYFIKKMREGAQRYNKNLINVKGISIPYEADWAKSIYWLYTILIDKSVLKIDRNQIATKLNSLGIETRPTFYPLHIQPPYLNNKESFPKSVMISKNGLSLPSYNDLSSEKIDDICKKIKTIIKNHQVIKSTI